MPTVSVIVPNYNHARFLRQRIDSILAQTYQDFELILLDDCSTDDSREILQEYASNPHVTHVEFNEANSGSTFKQWNKGVRLAQGKYVWIAESDDYADSRFLGRLVEELDGDPNIVLAYCRSCWVSADGKLSGFQQINIPGTPSERWAADFRVDGIEECRKILVHGCSIQNASAVVFRKAIYSQTGGADERLRQAGDWKAWASMALTGGTISYLADPLNYRRIHSGSVTETNLSNPQNAIRAFERPHVISWIFTNVKVAPEVVAKVRSDNAHLWLGAVLDSRIPVKTRRAVLRNALRFDPHALRRLGRAAASKFCYNFLEFTYAPRHALGLCRSRTAQARANGTK